MRTHSFLRAVMPLLSLTEAAIIREVIPSPQSLLGEALVALGGEDAIRSLTGVTYSAPTVFRSRSLMQSYELDRADTGVSSTGSQNVSFDLTSTDLKQRIDRRYIPAAYWLWGRPQLDQYDNSLVVSGGDDGFACYVKGNNEVWLPPAIASGYTKGAVAEYLVLRGQMLSPHLLLKMKESDSISASDVDINGVSMLAVHDSSLDITVILDVDTKIPHIIRTTEEHEVYGPSTSDLYLSDYKAVDGIMFPHTVQTIYNATTQHLNAVLEDFIIEDVTVNPEFPQDFFAGLHANESWTPKEPPSKEPGVSHARISEFTSNMLSSGYSDLTAEDLRAETLDSIPSVHWLVLDDAELGVKQMVIEFGDEVILGDAPPQYVDAVIDWVRININKPITHLWPTHHHRDHSGGARRFVDIGAKLIIPEMAVPYWSNIANAELITFNDTHPYVHRDNKTQAWFMWQEQATHAADWSYAVVTDRCLSPNSSIAALEADVWHPGMPAEANDQVLMRQWLDQVMADGLTQNAMVFPTHGQIRPLKELVDTTGSVYPSFNAANWQHGKASCRRLC